VAISLGKKGFIENHKKNKFSGFWWIVRALGADGPRVVGFYFNTWVLGKSFRENTLPGGLSVDPWRTVRYSLQNRVLLGGPGRRSVACQRTVRVAQADGPPGPTVSPSSRWLRVFTVRIQTRTVREVRVLSLTASNGKGSIYTPSPGLERLSCHFERSILPCRALPLLSLTHLA
jgi:hypothetical protein